MHELHSDSDRLARMFRVSRRDGMRLAGLGALLSLVGADLAGATAHDASPVASPGASCPSDPATNGATAARWFTEALNQGKLEALDEILDPNVVLDPAAFPPVTGVAQVRQTLGELLTAFPDVSYEIQDTLVEDDRVVIRWTASGTQAIDYAGIAATGEAQRWSGIHFFHFACDKIASVWAEADILAQLGLVDDVQATPIPFTGDTGSPGPACELSSPKEMEAFAHGWQDVWTSHDVTTYEGVVSPDAVHHFGVRADAVGLTAIQSTLTGFFSAFSDLQGPIEDIVIDGDRVAFRYTDSGTNDGSFFGSPPTGAPVSWTGSTILRVSCGQIVESWAEVDGFGLWRQLGLLETQGTPVVD